MKQRTSFSKGGVVWVTTNFDQFPTFAEFVTNLRFMNQLIINDSKFKEWFKYINHKVYIKKKTFEDVGNKEISIKKFR